MARSVVNRKNTTSYVANLIQFPFSSGEKYFAVTGKNKFILFNTKENLFNDNIVVNIDYGVREEPQNHSLSLEDSFRGKQRQCHTNRIGVEMVGQFDWVRQRRQDGT